MSDIYLAPSLPGKQVKKEAAVKWANANTVLQSIIQQLEAEDRKVVVLRCDELPLLRGPEKEMKIIFSGLLQMILQKKSSVTQLFLHINCKTGEQDLPNIFSVKQYTIQFNTNISPCADWMQLNAPQLTGINAIVQELNGSLAVGEAQGCLFSLTFPGKPI